MTGGLDPMGENLAYSLQHTCASTNELNTRFNGRSQERLHGLSSSEVWGHEYFSFGPMELHLRFVL